MLLLAVPQTEEGNEVKEEMFSREKAPGRPSSK